MEHCFKWRRKSGNIFNHKIRAKTSPGVTLWRHIYSHSFIRELYKALAEVTNLPSKSSFSGRVTASFLHLFWVISCAHAVGNLEQLFPFLVVPNCRRLFLPSHYVGGFAFLEKDSAGPLSFCNTQCAFRAIKYLSYKRNTPHL